MRSIKYNKQNLNTNKQMRKVSLLLLLGFFAMIMLSFTEAATLKSKVATSTKAKAGGNKASARRSALSNAKASLASYGSREEAKAAVKTAVEAKTAEKTEAIKARREAGSQ
eukprot:403356351